MISHASLSQHTCTDGYYFDPLFKGIKYTSGVKYLRDHGCNWLVVDSLANITGNKKLRKSLDFLCIKFNAKDGKGVFVIENGDGKTLERNDIPFTDCPEGEIKMFFTDGVLLLASEY